jgi:DNA-binding response OmpR family regulator
METKEATVTKKILLVEDEPDLAAAVQVRLETKGYKISIAYDGQEGLNKARTEKPDLIILDIMLPKIDGYKVCRMLKFDEKYQKIPVIMFSARVHEKDKDLAKECGADDYWVKPFEPEPFLARIKELLEKPK